MKGQEIQIKRRFGGVIGSALRAVLVMCVWTPLFVAVLATFQLSFMARDIPDIPTLDVLQPTFQSRVQLADGTRVSGAYATSQVPYDALPPQLLVTFLAAEDEDFFTHTAFNLRAILRAALENFRSGERTQGASTLSQQLAKQFTGAQKSYYRKVRELLLARRMEATFSKHELLRVYLETSFMGHTAYGVTQASWFYFAKDPRELDQGELATIAGLLPSPNRFSPLRHPERARKRRDRVLQRMHAMGVLSTQELEHWTSQPVVTRTRKRDQIDYPYVHASALRILTDDGNNSMLDMWSEGAYTITMPHLPDTQIKARNAVRQAVLDYDHRQGYRGLPDEQKLNDEEKVFVNKVFTRASVKDVHKEHLTLTVFTSPEPVDIELSLETLRWASDASLTRHYKRPRTLHDLTHAFTPGDEVRVRWSKTKDAWELAQAPRLQSALFSMDTITGQTLASVGGVEPKIDIYHRAEQSCRQPGSVFKPLVYTPALALGIHPATMLGDVPKELDNDAHGGTWTPRNADRNYKGYITMKQALAGSRNIPAAYLFDRVGSRRVIDLARKLGITDVLDPAPSLALGASCVKPVEMIALYTAFQRHGVRKSPVFFLDWRASDGEVIAQHTHYAMPFMSLSERLVAIADYKKFEQKRGPISREIADTMWWMLRQVVLVGTAHELPNRWPVAAKTGTTNKYDAWFIGFDGQSTTGVWVGSDKNKHALGPGEHGATVAMPAFEQFYREVSWYEDKLALPDWEEIFPLDTMTLVRIDEPTGMLARPNQYGVLYPFMKGQEPSELAPTQTTRKMERIDLLVEGL